LKGLPVVCRQFRDSVAVDIGTPFNRIEIADDAMNADIVINLPKLKTHTQMLLTLGVKNIFGCIVGLRKPEWHFRAGIDRDKFAELLVRIAAAVRPSITILDGILAMEGQGPGKGGVPRELGVVLASTDVFAVDAVVCRMLSLKEHDLPTNRIASKLRMMPENIAIDGALPAIRDMRFPVMTPLVFGPEGLHGFMRKHLAQRPVCDTALCRHCAECWRYCPAGAITPAQKGLTFDYEACIRCYCCIEVCPYGALSAKETAAGKIVRRMVKR
jgi:ferredoxin